MNISDSSYNLNKSYSGNVTVSSAKGGENLNLSNISGNAQITQIAEGQIFHGKIQNITGNEVSIILSNNKTLLAHMAESMTMNIGDSLDFLVKENNGTNILIKPQNQESGMMKDGAIFKALEINNLSPSEKNYQIAEALMNKNMPLDKASMQKIMQQSYKFPDASIDTLVAMNKLSIPVTESTIQQFNEYVSNNHQMINNINSLVEDISNVTRDIVSNMTVQEMENSQAALGDIIEFNTKLLGSISDEGDLVTLDFKAMLKDVLVEKHNIDTANINQGTKDNLKEFSLSNVIAENVADLADRLSLSEDNVEDVFFRLSQMGIPENALNELAKKSETPMQLINNINKLISDAREAGIELPVEQIKDMLKSDQYIDVFKESVKKKLSIDPNNMKEPNELDDLYKNIYDKASKLSNAFSGNGSAGQSLSESAKSMQEKIEFIQNLNELYTYAQIPVNLSGKDMNSELFVYMNKKNLSKTKEEVSALLHLDMDNLGPTDVHVSLRGSTVHTRFYVEDEASAKIIDDHMNMLEKAINDNGFSLTNEVITREPAISTATNMVVKEMFGDDLEKSVKRYTFDIRM